MEITTVCTMLLCASMSDHTEYPNYNIELRLEDAAYNTNQHIQHLEYLDDVKDFNIKNQLEDVLRQQIVERTNIALGRIHTQTVLDELAGKKVNLACYEDYKEYALNAAKDAIHLLEPCLSKVEYQTIDLSTKVQIKKANAELLAAELEQVRSACSVTDDSEQGQCYETGLNEIARKLAESKEELNKLYELYHDTLNLVPESIECIHQGGNDVQQELDGILQNAVQCQDVTSHFHSVSNISLPRKAYGTHSRNFIGICLTVFCIEIFDYFEHDTYPYELKAESLTFQNKLLLQNVTRIKVSMEYSVKNQGEQAIHDTLVAKTQLTLDKLGSLASSAKKKKRSKSGIKSCYENQKAEVRLIFRNKMLELESCNTEIVPKYSELTVQLEQLNVDINTLQNEIRKVTDECMKISTKMWLACLEFELNHLQRKQQLLEYTYSKLNTQYEHVLGLVTSLVECIKGTEDDIVKTLYSLLTTATKCYSALEDKEQ